MTFIFKWLTAKSVSVGLSRSTGSFRFWNIQRLLIGDKQSAIDFETYTSLLNCLPYLAAYIFSDLYANQACLNLDFVGFIYSGVIIDVYYKSEKNETEE